MKKILFIPVLFFYSINAFGSGLHIPMDTHINKKNVAHKKAFTNKSKKNIKIKKIDDTVTTESYIPKNNKTVNNVNDSSEKQADDFSLESWVGNKNTYTAYSEYVKSILTPSNIIYQRNPIFIKYFPNGNIDAPIAENPDIGLKSILVKDKFNQNGDVKLIKLKPTPATIAEHKEFVDMVKDMGYGIDESENSLEITLPERYAKNGENIRMSIMRAMFLSNEIINKHFFVYPDCDKVSVLMKNSFDNKLVSYDLYRKDWQGKSNKIMNLDLNNTDNKNNALMKNMVYYNLNNKEPLINKKNKIKEVKNKIPNDIVEEFKKSNGY